MTHSQINRAWHRCIVRASRAPTKKALKIIARCAVRIGDPIGDDRELRQLVREAHKIDWRKLRS